MSCADLSSSADEGALAQPATRADTPNTSTVAPAPAERVIFIAAFPQRLSAGAIDAAPCPLTPM